jgi:hypothetical protein
VLLAIIANAVVGLARVRVWSVPGPETAEDSHRFTIGMLVLAFASSLFLSWGDEFIDPLMDFIGANTSNIAQRLLLVFASYELVVSFNRRHWSDRKLRAWRITTIVVSFALVGSYLFSDEFDTPAREFQLTDPGSTVNNWVWIAWLVIAFTAVLITGISHLTDPGFDLRHSLLLTILVGLAGAGTGVATAVLMTIRPEWLHTHYPTLARVGATFALAALAAAGVPGFRAAWAMRDEPR